MKILLFSLLFLYVFQFSTIAQIVVDGISIKTENVAENLDTPWEILWGPDDYIWITERYGRISRLNPDTKVVTPLITIGDVHEESESGLLGMALHPNFTENPYVYVVYNYFESSIREKVVRYTYANDELSDPEVLLENVPGNRTHNGSRILFGADGKLYFSFGDVSNSSNAQDLVSLNGKILRMNPDGSTPDDNPFPESLVYSYGHRNPQGMVFTPDTRLYSSEHGPQNDDEVNRIEAGANYGWPDVEGFCDGGSEQEFCNSHSVIEPLAAWTPTLAVAGLDYYSLTDKTFWENQLLLTSLKAGKMLSLQLSPDGNEISSEKVWINDQFGRLRDICISPQGRVFIATSNRDGRGSPADDDDRIIELIPEIVSNIHSGSSNYQISVFPNPVSAILTVDLPEQDRNYSLSLLDLSGKKLFESTANAGKNQISVQHLENGIYLLHAESELYTDFFTIVIAH